MVISYKAIIVSIIAVYFFGNLLMVGATTVWDMDKHGVEYPTEEIIGKGLIGIVGLIGLIWLSYPRISKQLEDRDSRKNKIKSILQKVK